MPQFLVRPEVLAGEPARFRIDGPEAFHIVKVLRYAEGSRLDLFDGRGGRYRGRISRIAGDESVEGVIEERLADASTRRLPSVRLYQGLLKAGHWEWLLEKGTEIGVASFRPVSTAHSVVSLGSERVKAKRERWSRVLLGACKQSGRLIIPEIRDPLPFAEALREARDGVILLAWEKMSGEPAGAALKSALADRPASVNVFVGPEGGFSKEEVALALGAGAVLFGLGPQTLRAETAGIVACSLVLYELGGL